MLILDAADPLVQDVVAAIRAGDVVALTGLLAEHPELATAGYTGFHHRPTRRTLLHLATDWPGHLPNVGATIAALVAAGADVNGRFVGWHTETALHWAASSDDVEAIDALLDAGADIEADGGVIGGGTPVLDAAAFGQWNAAHRLVERGATTGFWPSAALGLSDRVEGYLSAEPSRAEITEAFWGACHGGQVALARRLLDAGAELNWIGWDDLTPLDVAIRAEADELVTWLRDRGARTTAELRGPQPSVEDF